MSTDPRRPFARFGALLRRAARDETGAVGIGGVFWTSAGLALSGLAIDGANAWRVQNQLQIAADASALGAAAQLPDEALALDAAVSLAQRNVGAGIIRPEDVRFGTWDHQAKTFTDGGTEPNAVRVNIERSRARDNAVATFLLRLVGTDTWDIPAAAVAVTSETPGGGSVAGCENTTFLSASSVQVGGGNTFLGPVCIHGETGAATGGNDYFDPAVRISAPAADLITINPVRAGSAEAEDVSVVRSMEPRLLPMIDGLYAELWQALYTSGVSEYSGDLVPDFVKNEQGFARVVRKEGMWSIQPGEVEPNTIYVVNGSAQFSGDLDASKVAFVVKGKFGVGGGWKLNFSDMFAIGDQVNLAGNVSWGDPEQVCLDERYNVYVFGRTSLAMGGFGNGAQVHGVVGAAPRLSPGGGMHGTGVYLESEQNMVLGGYMEITGCGTPLDSEYELALPEAPASSARAGSYLVR